MRNYFTSAKKNPAINKQAKKKLKQQMERAAKRLDILRDLEARGIISESERIATEFSLKVSKWLQ